jgi:hypothetical protein
MCLATARSGGMSIVSSALAAHNYFLRERPELLRRLYEPFYRDHQEYQAADAAATNFRPIFGWAGQLRTPPHLPRLREDGPRAGRGSRRSRDAERELPRRETMTPTHHTIILSMPPRQAGGPPASSPSTLSCFPTHGGADSRSPRTNPRGHGR